MKIYGNPIAPTTRMLQTLLAEKGEPAELVVVDFSMGEQRRAEHLARHPFGVTPVLEDDGYSIYETRAILRYLDRRFPSPALSPADTRAFGRMEQFIGIEQSYLSPNVMTLVYSSLRPATPEALEKAREQIKKPLDVAERALEDGLYLAGEGFSLADIVWMPYVSYLFDVGTAGMVSERPRLVEWWGRVSARPSWVPGAPGARR